MMKTYERKFQFGIKAKDIITGFTGTITGHCSYITGCDQYLIAPPIDSSGNHVEGRWYDVNRVEALEEKPSVTLNPSEDDGPCEAAPVK